MPQIEATFASDMDHTGVTVPKSVTADLPFEMTRAVISNRPLRRRRGDIRGPITPNEAAELRRQAVDNPPPDAWYDEEFPDAPR